MKNDIDSHFAIAILTLVAACVGFAFWLNIQSDTIADLSEKSSGNVIEKKKTEPKFVEEKTDEWPVLEQPFSRTYRSAKDSFSFEHGNDWFISEDEELYALKPYRDGVEDVDFIMPPYFIKVLDNQTIEEYLAGGIGDSRILAQEDFSSAGERGKKILLSADIGLEETIYLFEGDEKLYVITFMGIANQDIKGAEMIVSSFFIE